MKILYITTIGGTMTFFKSLIKELIDEGHVVDIATNETDSKVPDCYREWGCKVYPISTSRSSFSTGNIRAINEIRSIAKDYDIVHCHTPLAAMSTRFASRPLRKDGLKVIYTAHGFHFYSGAPLKNWLLYFPMEWLCAHWTDVLITINKEDFERAKKCMPAKKVEYVPGVGIDVDKFANTKVDKADKRAEIGVPEDAFMVLSVGELNENKNHQIVIRAIAELKDRDIHYVIAGIGKQKDYLDQMAKDLGVNLHLLGYRKDVSELYKTADLYILPSKREGLNVSTMEAMASGLPIICSLNRGNKDFNSSGVILCDINHLSMLVTQIKELKESKEKLLRMTQTNTRIAESYDFEKINKKIIEIYFGGE